MHVVNTTAWLHELLADHETPCISMYLPFERSKPLSEQNRILLHDLIHQAEKIMGKRYDLNSERSILQRLLALGNDELLRGGDRDGIAVFVSPDYFRVIELPRSVDPMVEVADSFHIKPLVRVLQQGARFQVLCLSPNLVRLFEGNQYQLEEIPLSNVPRNIDETLQGLYGDFPTEPYGQQHLMRRHHPPTSKDNMGFEPFLRAVDNSIWENHSRDSKLPVVVCADEKHLSQFLLLTKNQYILPQGINHSPQHLSPDRLREGAWKIIEPRYHEELERLKEQYRVAKAHQKGSDELMQVAEAAATGRVGTLLVDETKKIPGILHRASGMIESPASPADEARADDVLDDLAELVLQKDGQVYVIPHDQMPTDAGLAAMFRY